MPDAANLPSEKEVTSLQKCDPVESYYITLDIPHSSSGEWRKVLHCAHLHNDITVLTMLYANGFGTKRNLDLALRYVCETPSSPIEMMARVEHITNLRYAESDSNTEARFDFCDVMISSYGIGYCVAINERRKDRVRIAQLQSISRHWSAAQQRSFTLLKQSLVSFTDARAIKETDMTGSFRAEAATEASAAEKQLFLEDIMQIDQGQLPTFTKKQFRNLDMQLNFTYQKVMHTPIEEGAHGFGYTTITKDDVRATQRLWLTYRDAFVAFGAARYPAVAPEAWKAMLTQRRIAQLAGIIAE